MNRGIDVGECTLLFYVKLFIGMRFSGNGMYKKQYAEDPVVAYLQLPPGLMSNCHRSVFLITWYSDHHEPLFSIHVSLRQRN